jgi:hypothetical protein
MFNNAAMFRRVQDRTITPRPHYGTRAQSRGGWIGATPPTASELGGGQYGIFRSAFNVDNFLVTERVDIAKITGVHMAYEQSDEAESSASVLLSDSDGNSLALPINHPFRKSSQWGRIVSDALKTKGVNFDANVGAALADWINHS